jgi:hypothetical protein
MSEHNSVSQDNQDGEHKRQIRENLQENEEKLHQLGEDISSLKGKHQLEEEG